MHIAGREQVATRYTEATYRYAHHMGGGEHMPAFAEAWAGSRCVEITSEQYPGLTGDQLRAKARALLLQGGGR